MKTRITDKHLRFRLSEEDISKLASEKTVATTTVFSPLAQLKIEISLWNLDTSLATFEHNTIKLQVSENALHQWASSDEEGLYFQQEASAVSTIDFAIEKDFPCKH